MTAQIDKDYESEMSKSDTSGLTPNRYKSGKSSKANINNDDELNSNI